MKVTQTKLEGVVIIEPEVYGDDRGFFTETYQFERYAQAGVDAVFVQDNHSRSAKGVLRGLHFQVNNPQGKLVRVTHGEVFDVAVDINPNSPTFRQYVGVHLSGQNHKQLYVPPGYAHGFCVLSDSADFVYKCTDYYDPADEGGIVWNDPSIAIEWPLEEPALSEKDKALPTLDFYSEKYRSRA